MGKFIDLTDQKFGRLTVIKRVENDKQGRPKWLCKCNCKDGNEKIVRASALKKGNTQSCGCLQKEKASQAKKKYNTYDLTENYGIGYTSKGEEFWFDLEDYDLIKNYCWSINNKYVVARSDEKNFLYMHRLVMNCPDDMKVDHIGYYDNFDKAVEVRKQAELEYFGEYRYKEKILNRNII